MLIRTTVHYYCHYEKCKDINVIVTYIIENKLLLLECSVSNNPDNMGIYELLYNSLALPHFYYCNILNNDAKSVEFEKIYCGTLYEMKTIVTMFRKKLESVLKQETRQLVSRADPR